MGAGHSRLAFELDTFTILQPAHFRVDEDYIERKWSGSSRVTRRCNVSMAGRSASRSSDRLRGGNVSTHRDELASSCSSTYQSSATFSMSYMRGFAFSPILNETRPREDKEGREQADHRVPTASVVPTSAKAKPMGKRLLLITPTLMGL